MLTKKFPEPNWTNGILLFPEKEAKSVVLLRRRRRFQSQASAKPTLGVWGRAPKESINYCSGIVFTKSYNGL
jgi:hypothetical protein